MKETKNKQNKKGGVFLLSSIILIFGIFGAIVFSVSQKISEEMAASAIQNLSESLDLIQSNIETILHSEAEIQKMLVREIGRAEDPEAFIRAYEENDIVVKLSLILSGRTEGISSNGELFTEANLDFSAGGTVEGLPVSQSYVNHMGTWSYTLKCPVERNGQVIGTLYGEYVYDVIDRSLPEGFYNKQTTLYIMDAGSRRFVLRPVGMGMRSAGHLDLADFYRANDIQDLEIRAEVEDCLRTGRDVMFYHDIRRVNALNYMWSVNEGTLFLVGYVPVESIQQEGRTVNQNIAIVVISLLVAFSLCIVIYYLNWRQQDKLRREREAERKRYNQQLADALHAAQIASESKTTFLSNMSHDIRTPMNAVLGFTALLARDAENPVKVREYTKKITSSGQHLLSLINDVLDVSKIESGKVVLTLEHFVLNEVISSVDAIIQPMAKAKGQEFHQEVTGIRHEYLVGDKMRIDQILLNLLSNAVKYTPEGGHIWFRIMGLKQRSDQYEHICIEVEDDGYGMTPEFLETIFDAFSREENSTTNKVQGTGLGMAITKSIVELMGGTIEVFSEVGHGSLFRVKLELRVQEGEADRWLWAEWGISHILLAGGHPENWESMRTLAEDTGIRLESCVEPEEALNRIRGGESFQLVLLDWEDCGIQAVRELRRELPESASIVILAELDAEGLEEVLALGRTGVLTKPFFVSALRIVMKELWEEKEPEQEETNVLRGMNFLAAEDNEINAEILTEVLAFEGASCEVVENGRLALERFQKSAPGEFDGILMDVQMPVMNGHEATRAIRALEREDAKQILIIAMTANAFAEDEKAALDAGMDAHVAKPLNIELLKKVIWQLSREKENP